MLHGEMLWNHRVLGKFFIINHSPSSFWQQPTSFLTVVPALWIASKAVFLVFTAHFLRTPDIAELQGILPCKIIEGVIQIGCSSSQTTDRQKVRATGKMHSNRFRNLCPPIRWSGMRNDLGQMEGVLVMLWVWSKILKGLETGNDCWSMCV